MLKLSILVLNYKTKDLTIYCLQSLINHYKKELEKGDFEIIVGDNGSLDGSLDALKEFANRYKNIQVVDNKENLGFAKGHNRLAKRSQAKYLLFLNSDMEVCDEGFLGMTRLLEENKTVGVVGGKIVKPTNIPELSCGKFYNLLNLFLMLVGLERIAAVRFSPSNTQRVDWVSGGCMLLEKDLFLRLGGFDENFFMYMEDMEFCFRINLLGLQTYFFKDTLILHKEHGSSNRAFAIINIYRGILYFYRKHKGNFVHGLAKFVLTAKAVFAILIGIILNNNYLKKTYAKALKF